MTRVLADSGGPLADSYELLLLDLDGTVYRGQTALPGVVEELRALRERGSRLRFVTNNASRTPAQVSDHLTGLGVEAAAEEVLTAAQAGARVVADLVSAGAAVLVVGGDGLVDAVEAVGLRPVTRCAEDPAAVIQGWWPGVGWAQLAEGAYALARGIPWVATNVDLTLPTEHGIAPGNGSFVRLLAAVSAREPDAVAGKPGPVLLQLAAQGRPALAVGDRLDTDIEGAVAAGLDSLLVLSGVTDVRELLFAPPGSRPTYVCRRLGGLREVHPAPRAAGPSTWECGAASVTLQDGWLRATAGGGMDRASVEGADDLLRAACLACWELADAGSPAQPDAQLCRALAG